MLLSACQTAKGDHRAVLGLAEPVGCQSESTAKFMGEFYKQLSQPGTSKAEALRKAQIAFLQDANFSHPYYWAPFILVGNWL